MSGDGKGSGEINVLILQRITEVASEVKAVSSGQADLKTSMMLQFQEGKHRMDGMAERITDLENGKNDDDSDWSKPAKHKHQAVRQRDVPTEPISKKLDLSVWIKYGAMIGAAVAGAYAAVKAGGS